MFKNKEIEQQPSQRGSVIAIPEKHLRSSMQVLNRVIIELRKTEVDIRKISLFEEPPEAIVHINDPVPPAPESSWLQRLRNSKKKHLSLVRVKLNVTKAPDVQNLFLLEYETLPREV